MSTISGISSSMISTLSSQAMRKRPDPTEKFNELDTDANGGLSQAELEVMAEEIAAQTGQTLDIEEAITTYDVDGDQLLSQDEMGTMMMELHETMGPPPPPSEETSQQQASLAYLLNSEDEDQMAALLELMKQYSQSVTTDSSETTSLFDTEA